MSDTLKPCPFCGNEASPDGRIKHHANHDAWWADGTRIVDTFYVNCIRCGCDNKSMFGHQSKALAIAAWNTRAAPTVKPLVWERLSDNCYRAKSPHFGSLRVETYGGEKWLSQWSVPGYCDSFVDGDFQSADKAKAATQERYAARILSALEDAT